jgi:hypothetical protein
MEDAEHRPLVPPYKIDREWLAGAEAWRAAFAPCLQPRRLTRAEAEAKRRAMDAEAIAAVLDPVLANQRALWGEAFATALDPLLASQRALWGEAYAAALDPVLAKHLTLRSPLLKDFIADLVKYRPPPKDRGELTRMAKELLPKVLGANFPKATVGSVRVALSRHYRRKKCRS